jgi:predicted nucleotidyltransferase
MSTTRDHNEMVDGLKMLADKIYEVLHRLQAGEATDEDRRLARRIRRARLLRQRPSELVKIHAERIRRVVASHKATNPRVFGTVMRGQDTEDTALELLVDPLDGMTLFDIGGIAAELEGLLDVEVGVVTTGPQMGGFNSRRQAAILAEAEPI